MQSVAQRPHWMHFPGSSCHTRWPAEARVTTRAETPPSPAKTEALAPFTRNCLRVRPGLLPFFFISRFSLRGAARPFESVVVGFRPATMVIPAAVPASVGSPAVAFSAAALSERTCQEEQSGRHPSPDARLQEGSAAVRWVRHPFHLACFSTASKILTRFLAGSRSRILSFGSTARSRPLVPSVKEDGRATTPLKVPSGQ